MRGRLCLRGQWAWNGLLRAVGTALSARAQGVLGHRSETQGWVWVLLCVELEVGLGDLYRPLPIWGISMILFLVQILIEKIRYTLQTFQMAFFVEKLTYSWSAQNAFHCFLTLIIFLKAKNELLGSRISYDCEREVMSENKSMI